MSQSAKSADFPASIHEYEEAIRIKPDTMNAHYNLAVVLEKAGQVERARQEYQTYLQLSPDAADSAEVRARLKKMGSGGE